MYNWRLLLFGFLAFFQPIASFTERRLVDGRQQCCDHQSPYGTNPVKIPLEIRSLNYRREVTRDEFRHDNTVLTRPPINSVRDTRYSREQKLNSPPQEFMTRISRSEGRRMSGRVLIPEDRLAGSRITRNLERNRVLESSRSRQITNLRDSNGNDSPLSKRTINQDQSIAHQRVERRLRDNNDSEFRRNRDTTPVPRFNRVNDRVTGTMAFAERNGRRMHHSNGREMTRHESRRDEERLNRFSDRHAVMRRSSVEFTTNDNERRTERRNTRINVENRPSLLLSKQREFNTRDIVLKERNEIRDTRVNPGQILNADRRNERHVTRERILTERLSTTPRVQTRRLVTRSDRQVEQSTTRENDDTNTRFENRQRSLSRSFRTEESERDNIRRSTSRLTTDNIREREIVENRRMLSSDRSRERVSRYQVNEERSDRRKTVSLRRDVRAFDEREHHDERDSVVRREVRERARSLETERHHVARRETRERTRSMESERYMREDGRLRARSRDAERYMREDDRKNVDRRRYDGQSRRNVNERLSRERFDSETRRDTRIAATEMSRDLSSERGREISRVRITERHVDDKRSVLARRESNKDDSVSYVDTWEYLMYAMQGVYLCTIFLPMLMTKKNATKKSMSIWGTTYQKLIKVD